MLPQLDSLKTAALAALDTLSDEAALEAFRIDYLGKKGQLTALSAGMATGMPQADGSLRPEARMDVVHAANAVVQMASVPLDANVLFMTVMATRMPFVGRG